MKMKCYVTVSVIGSPLLTHNFRFDLSRLHSAVRDSNGGKEKSEDGESGVKTKRRRSRKLKQNLSINDRASVHT
jgi:hypothetical protein